MNHITLIPIQSSLRLESFDLAGVLLACVAEANECLVDGDVLIVSSKFMAIAEGRVIRLADVTPSQEAQRLAETYSIEPALAELVIQESDHIFGGIQGFLLSVRDNVIAPNAGIDTSNVPEGSVVLYPSKPFESTERLRSAILQQMGVHVGVVCTDSRLMPGRTGTTGVAIGVAGFLPVVDERGKSDLLGRPLRVSQRAVADNLCAAAELLMGEADEGIPIVIARDTGIVMTQERRYDWRDLAIDYKLDIYVSIIGGNS